MNYRRFYEFAGVHATNMSLTVLSDADVRTLLLSLSSTEVEKLRQDLCEALHEYSTGTQETSGCCSSNQPPRIAIPGPDSSTTLFMPASTSTSRGMKIVSLGSPAVPTRESSIFSEKDASTPTSASSSQPPSIANLSLASSGSSSTLSTASTQTAKSTLFPISSVPSSQSTTPRGSLTLISPQGNPYALVNAEELTAFRTALASTQVFSKRTNVHSVLVFGAGKQAEWHIRLALLLRGEDIHHVDIVNRSFTRASDLLQRIYTSPEWEELRNKNKKLKFSVVTEEYGEYARILKEHVRKADAIFMCTPSTEPLFPAEHLTSHEGRRKGRYISCIGSYRPHMCELHPDILRQAVSPEHKNHHHKHAGEGGVIVVDSLTACMKEAGEVRAAGLKADQLVEFGELVMVKRAAMREIEMGGRGEQGLKKWLFAGNVIYKSVGLGLMDISVGEGLVGLARNKRIGTTVENF